ncbi:MAG: endolytic transglycosylase MltG, partial [Myxococcota bacterium]
MSGRLLRTGAAILALGTLGVAVPISGLYVPAATEPSSRVFEVAPGESLSSVARRLEAEGLLPDRLGFGPKVLVTVARLTGTDREIKAGEYELDRSLTPLEILERIRTGAIRTLLVTIPEGLRIDEIASRLEGGGITSASSLVRHANDPEFTASQGIEASSLEGYLYPETYRFRRDTPAPEVLRTFVKEFRSRWTDADRELLAESGRTLNEVVTIASLVEKETAVSDERPLVAAVFTNRLSKRMRLQSDPTVIYGIIHTRGEFDGNIRRRDLETDTPYNTYTRGGFPPGPIANPSMEAIRA